jgi:hypothetical protein
MTKRAKVETRQKATSGGGRGYVGTPFTISTVPTWSVPATATEPQDFTKDIPEDTLNKASSRPIKGKYADILPSSDEFVSDKRAEVELEERSS